MSCSPAELSAKISALERTWLHYAETPSFENFVEYAVSLNSVVEFLIARGLSGLLHACQELEQAVLAWFGDESGHPLSEAVLGELGRRQSEFGALVRSYVEQATTPERRQEVLSPTSGHDLLANRNVWLVGLDPTPWNDLLTQLGYFGLLPGFHSWDAIPVDSGSPLLLVDVSGLAPAEWQARLRALRSQFPASRIICLALGSDFELLQAALKCGCDLCFPDGTPLQQLVAQVLELNDPKEQEAFRILIVEDSLTATKLIRRALEENHVLTHSIRDPREVLNALTSFSPDLILMDMYMPGCTGVEAARVIRQHDQYLSIPIVYLSGETDVGLQIEALRLGGDHFLTKPFNPVFLNAIVKSKIERYRALRRSMYHDSLTGLLNHTSTKAALESGLQASLGHGLPMTVAMIDIDHFKRVNDNYGHPIGDQIIRSLAWLLKQHLRKNDIIGRYGGEEFLIGLPGLDAEQGLEVMERIREDFSRINHPYRDTYFSITFSGGLASSAIFADTDKMINAADEVLYLAKRGGRNRLASAG